MLLLLLWCGFIQRVNIQTKFEEEEKEKLEKLRKEWVWLLRFCFIFWVLNMNVSEDWYVCIAREEDLQLQKRKKRKTKGSSKLSFADDFENGSDEEDGENSKKSHDLA